MQQSPPGRGDRNGGARGSGAGGVERGEESEEDIAGVDVARHRGKKDQK